MVWGCQKQAELERVEALFQPLEAQVMVDGALSIVLTDKLQLDD